FGFHAKSYQLHWPNLTVPLNPVLKFIVDRCSCIFKIPAPVQWIMAGVDAAVALDADRHAYAGLLTDSRFVRAEEYWFCTRHFFVYEIFPSKYLPKMKIGCERRVSSVQPGWRDAM